MNASIRTKRVEVIIQENGIIRRSDTHKFLGRLDDVFEFDTLQECDDLRTQLTKCQKGLFDTVEKLKVEKEKTEELEKQLKDIEDILLQPLSNCSTADLFPDVAGKLLTQSRNLRNSHKSTECDS